MKGHHDTTHTGDAAQPIYVAGFQVRTSNDREMSGNGEIGKLWGRFIQQNLASQIPGRVGHTLIAVYCDYASDEKGDYRYLLWGARSRVSTNCVWSCVPSHSARCLCSDQHRQGRCNPGCPRSLASDLGHVSRTVRRATRFRQDYEVYDHRSADPRMPRSKFISACRRRNPQVRSRVFHRHP